LGQYVPGTQRYEADKPVVLQIEPVGHAVGEVIDELGQNEPEKQ
jgi:hypothetical protein